MKRKLIALLSACMLCIPFITPIYAEDVWYWDGVIYSTTSNVVEVNGVNNFVNTASRLRFNYRPDYAYRVTLAPQYSGGGFEYVWYVGRYSESSTPTDVAVFVLKLDGYIDTVAANSIGYTSSKIAKNRYYGFSIQVGSGYDWYVGYCTDSSQYFKSKLNHNMIVLSNSYATSASTVKLHLETALGYNSDYSRFTDKSSPDAGFLYTNTSSASGDYSDYRFAPNVYTAFSNEVITPSLYPNGDVVPGTGYADGSNGTGGSDGSGSDGGNGGNGSGSSGSMQQQQQQQQYIEEGAITNNVSPTATIENDAVNVTVNNKDGMDAETVTALDDLLENQGINTSFNDAISNINGFRALGVAFASTVTVFLGWLPTWVTSLLALMFTLLFFFIILRLLKVFHG